MTDENPTEDQPAGEDEGLEPDTENDEQEPDAEQAEGDEPTEDETEDEPAEEEPTTLSHDDALKTVSKLRKENASWRTRFRDLEAKMAEATTPESVDELKADFAAQSRQLLVENVALKFDLPAELSERLTGTTREELEADAKKLVKFVTKEAKSADDLSGGLDPSNDDGEFDAQAYARDLRRRSRTF